MSFNTSNAVAGDVLAAILNTLPAAFALTGIAAASVRYARKLNAATRHVIWWTVLLAVIALPVVRYLGTRDSAGSPTPASGTLAATSRWETVPVVSSAALHVDNTGNEIVAATQDPAPGGFEVEPGAIPAVLAFLVAFCLVLQMVRVGWSYRHLRRLKRSGTTPSAELRQTFDEWLLACRVLRPVRLKLSSDLISPIAVGFRHPAVILPDAMVSELSADEIDHLLLHELAHLARRDDWTNLLLQIARGLLALHPIAWWILRRIDEERELACDDWVVDCTGAAQPYAVSLSRLVEFREMRSSEMLATGVGGRTSRIGDRIERLLRAGSNLHPNTSVKRIAVSSLLLLAGMVLCTQAPSWIAFARTAELLDQAPLDEAPMDEPAQGEPIATPVPEQDQNPAPAPTPVVPQTPPTKVKPRTGVARSNRLVVAAPVAPPEPPLPVHTPPAHPLPVHASPGQTPPTPVPPAPAPPPPDVPHASARGGSYLKALADVGYNNLSVDEIIDLKNSGVPPAYMAAMNQAGWGKLSIQQLKELRDHGISPEYLREIRQAGVSQLTLRDVIDLKNHGIRPANVKEIHGLGFGPYSARQIIDFNNNSVKVELFRAFRDAGFTTVDPKEITEARMHGVSGNDLQEAQKYGSKLTLRQITRLKQAGVI